MKEYKKRWFVLCVPYEDNIKHVQKGCSHSLYDYFISNVYIRKGVKSMANGMHIDCIHSGHEDFESMIKP